MDVTLSKLAQSEAAIASTRNFRMSTRDCSKKNLEALPAFRDAFHLPSISSKIPSACCQCFFRAKDEIAALPWDSNATAMVPPIKLRNMHGASVEKQTCQPTGSGSCMFKFSLKLSRNMLHLQVSSNGGHPGLRGACQGQVHHGKANSWHVRSSSHQGPSEISRRTISSTT